MVSAVLSQVLPVNADQGLVGFLRVSDLLSDAVLVPELLDLLEALSAQAQRVSSSREKAAAVWLRMPAGPSPPCPALAWQQFQVLASDLLWKPPGRQHASWVSAESSWKEETAHTCTDRARWAKGAGGSGPRLQCPVPVHLVVTGKRRVRGG